MYGVVLGRQAAVRSKEAESIWPARKGRGGRRGNSRTGWTARASGGEANDSNPRQGRGCTIGEPGEMWCTAGWKSKARGEDDERFGLRRKRNWWWKRREADERRG